jgi:hypothetical protein
MRKTQRAAWAAMIGLVGIAGVLAVRARAEHFDVLLHVETGTQQASAFMDTTPPIGGVNKRPIVRAKANAEIRVKWRMKSAFPHGVMKGVGIHFFVVREVALGQKPVPDPDGPAGVVDNSLVMDFAPNGVASGTIRFKLDTPGNYLVRVQSEDTHQEHDHEHFAAIDVAVE